MPTMERFDDIDIYWVDEKPKVEKDAILLIAMQGEQGFASFITMMGCVGDAKPIANICSKLHSVEAFNTVPEPMNPSWILYQVGNNKGDTVYILRLTTWYSLVAQPDANPHAWLYSYSVARDTLRALDGLGINQLIFLTTNSLQRFIESGDEQDDIAVFPAEIIQCYDFIEDSELERDIVLTTPAWVFPYIFRLMVGEDTENYLAVVVCAGVDEGYIDEGAVTSLSEYCESVIGLELDKEKMEKMRSLLTDLKGELNMDMESVKRLEAKLRGSSVNGDSVMWT